MSPPRPPLPRVGRAAFDERRNTSRVFGVDPRLHDELRRALAAFRRDDPALVQWILDGHPNLSPDEHERRFGEPYRPRQRKR